MSHGRPLTPLADARPPFFLGIDVGGTNTKFGIVDEAGSTLARTSVKTQVDRGPDDAVRRMGETARQLIAETGLQSEDVPAVGLATPGTMDVPAGMLLQPPNLPGWENYPIRDRVSEACGQPVTFANDANAAAFGEYWVGSASDYFSMVMLTLGTGVGGGIIIGDTIVDGVNSHGSECGHVIIDWREDARVGPHGRQAGHLESYASATALIARGREALEAGRETSLHGRVEAGEDLTPLLMAAEANAGDELSRELILQTAMFLGVGVVTLMHTIDPNAVILGGAMNFGGKQTDLGRAFLDRVKEEVRRRAFPLPAEKTVIDFAMLGGEAGYLGAAGLARKAYHRDR